MSVIKTGPSIRNLTGGPATLSWIVSMVYDQWFLFYAWLVPVALWAISSGGAAGLPTAFFLFIVLDKAHICCTWLLSFCDRQTMREAGRWYITVFAFFLLFATATVLCGGVIEALFVSLPLYWGPYHVLAQHYGFLRLYQARSFIDPSEARDEIWCLYAGCIFPIALNLHYGWIFASLPHPDIFKIHVPIILAWGILAVFLVATGRIIWYNGRRCLYGEPVAWTRLFHLTLAVSNFWLGILVAGRTNFMVAWIFITSYHNLQYLALVWLVGRNRYGPRSASKENSFSPVFQGGSPLPFVVLVTLGSMVYVTGLDLTPSTGQWFYAHPQLATWMFMFLSANFLAHYAFDARLWKLRGDKRLRADLGIEGGASATRKEDTAEPEPFKVAPEPFK